MPPHSAYFLSPSVGVFLYLETFFVISEDFLLTFSYRTGILWLFPRGERMKPIERPTMNLTYDFTNAAGNYEKCYEIADTDNVFLDLALDKIADGWNRQNIDVLLDAARIAASYNRLDEMTERTRLFLFRIGYKTLDEKYIADVKTAFVRLNRAYSELKMLGITKVVITKNYHNVTFC